MKQIIFSAFFLCGLCCCAQQTDSVDFKRAVVDVFEISDTGSVSGTVVYTFDVLKDVDSVYLDAKNFNLFQAVLDGDEKHIVKSETGYDGKHIVIKKALKANTSHNLMVVWEATPKKAFYAVRKSGDVQIWTQGQGKYTSNWLPSIDDTNDKIEFDIEIGFNNGYEVISNGSLVSKQENKAGTKWKFNMNHPMSSYLVALVIGKYHKKTELSKSGIPLEMYYYPEDSNKVESTYRYTKQMFDFLETEIGVAYPWQNYKQIPVHDFLYAGMENTGTTIFSDAFVVDSIAFNDKNYVNVNAHELAHQWFGDLVTAKSGEHHWLQEGFATYYALLAERDVFGDNHYYWQLYTYYQELVDQERHGNGTSLLNPKSSSLTFYKRGCWVLHALKDKVGEEAFKIAVKRYLQKHQFGNVETSDFITEVETASGQNLTEFVTLWIENKAFPEAEAKELLMQSSYIQEYEMADCETLNSKCEYYLSSGISDEAKVKIISQAPQLITSETFKNGLKVRQAIAQNLSKISETLKKDYESLLTDKSYVTIEAALYHLWLNFPEDRAKYFTQTKDIEGLSNKNVRLLWLVMALSTPEYQPENDLGFYNELVNYTSEEYNFEVRMTAFQYLEALNGCNEECQANLETATQHHNWRMVTFAKDLKERLKTNQN